MAWQTLQPSASSGGGGGITEYDTWADLPASADDGDAAAVQGVVYTWRASAEIWLPSYLPGTTRDTNRSWTLADSLTDITGRGAWTVALPGEVSKSAAGPLTFNAGAGTSIIMSCNPPTYPATAVFKGVTGIGTGRLWGYFGDGTKLTEFFGPSASVGSATFRDSAAGTLKWRELPVAAGDTFALGFVTAPERGVILWSSGDTGGPIGASQSNATLYSSGTSTWRLLRGLGAGYQTTVDELIVLT